VLFGHASFEACAVVVLLAVLQLSRLCFKHGFLSDVLDWCVESLMVSTVQLLRPTYGGAFRCVGLDSSDAMTERVRVALLRAFSWTGARESWVYTVVGRAV
jgi:hypothetical protein